MCKYALREMVRQKSGAIINVAAARAARLGGNVGYAASKAAIIGITKKMAREYAPDNVRVNCICPTNIQASPDPDDPRLPQRAVARDGTPGTSRTPRSSSPPMSPRGSRASSWS
jgi:NAD(P)-dependent dehydrogenase (short-subunit alcohol dehydrogenase family)